MHNLSLKNKYKTAAGVSLIEVLVALLLVSVAGFSILSMTSFANQDSNSLKFEMSADYLARGILSRAEVNASTTNKNTYTFDSDTLNPTEAPDCTSGCSNDEIAVLDIHEWAKEAKDLLPAVQYKSWWTANELHLAIAWHGPIKLEQEKGCPFAKAEQIACKVYTTTIADRKSVV